MVLDTYEPTKKGKATSAAELYIKNEKYITQSTDSKDLETTKDLTSPKTLPKDSKNHGKRQSSSTSDGLD